MVNLVIKENGQPDFIVGSFADETKCDEWISKAKLKPEQIAEKTFVPLPDFAAAEAVRQAYLAKVESAKSVVKSFKKGDFKTLADVENAFEKLLEAMGIK